MKMQNLKEKLFDLLKSDTRIWNEEKTELNETLLKDMIDKLDEKLLEIFLDNKEIKEKFFIKVKNVYVLKQNELKFFIDENKLDNSYTQYRNKIGLRVGNKLLSERDEVVLDWPFKDCVLEGSMTKEDQKRNEIFFNEVLAKDEIDRLYEPKALVNWKRYTAEGEEKVIEIKRDKDGTIRENLIIKGNNLLALHTLKKEFAGKVKLIYIDPPYNTGNDGFKYNDNFNKSSWLTFMKNRVEVARDLLSEDGSIYVQIDTKESHYLKVLLDEIFGKGNFRSQIIWDTSIPYVAGNKWLSNNWIYSQSTILYYAKNKCSVIFNKRTFEIKQPSGDISKKPYKDVWTDIKNFSGFLGAKDIKLEFNTRKPEHLIERIILSSTNPGDIVLDYHLGSGTTCAVAHKMGCQYIGIEQMDYIETVAIKRLQKVIEGEQGGISKSVNWQGGGDFIYLELAKWNEEAKEKILNAKSLDELIKLFDELYERYFLNYNVKIKEFKEKIIKEEEFKKLSLDEKKKLFVEMLDMNQMYVNFSERNDKKYGLSADDIKISEMFYSK